MHDDIQMVPAKVVYVVAQSFMVNDYPAKGVCATFHVGDEVKDPEIVKQFGSYLKRTVKEAEDGDVDELLDNLAEDKIKPLSEENAGLKQRVKELEENVGKLTSDNGKLTKDLESANAQLKTRDAELKAANKKIAKLTAR